ncbi:MAG: hypothetical protein Q4E88_01800 [Coriobacteriia bacterium]|nr:hypothetical protein [Coriobacteriia bacterium]
MTNLKTKKSVLAIVLSVAVLAVIAMFSINFANNSNSADAADSPVVPAAESNGVVFMINKVGVGDASKLRVRATNTVAKEAQGRSDIVANFEIYTTDGSSLGNYQDVTLTVGGKDAAKVQGQHAKIFIQHHDNTNEVKEGDFNNSGAITLQLEKLSYFTICGNFAGGGGGGHDSGDTSPKTGLY